MLLRKLGYSSEKNKLFLVAQEVGRVIRTMLEWINNSKLRREVTATTNIIESYKYNAFAKWLSLRREERDCRK